MLTSGLSGGEGSPSALSGSMAGEEYDLPQISPRMVLDRLLQGVPDEVLNGPIPKMTPEMLDKVYETAANAGFASGGILRKAAVKGLAIQAKGIMKTAEGVTDPYVPGLVREQVQNTLKEVIPAVRKLDQEWWDPIGGANWKFFKDVDTRGEIAVNKDAAVSFHPYKATDRTVYHEVAGHGAQYVPSEELRKALVPYKGEMVPAGEVLDYITRVSKNWRKFEDYSEVLYGKDPTEMHARLVAKDIASGIAPEEAFLARLPRVVQAFERENPGIVKNYQTPVLERVARRQEEKIKAIERISNQQLLTRAVNKELGKGVAPRSMEPLDRPLIAKAMKVDYADGSVDITADWKVMSVKEKQDAIAAGLHIETDRSGRKVIGNISQNEKTERLRRKVMALAAERAKLKELP